MSCPHFEPLLPLDWASWPARLRPPLGAPHDGLCRAGATAVHPDLQTLQDCCNMGYAAGRCARFRPGQGEAVRFAVASGPAGELRVRWLVEADGLPLLSGEVALSTLDAGTLPGNAPPLVETQLRAYASSYRALAMLR